MFWNTVSGLYDLFEAFNSKANNRTAELIASYVRSSDTVLECACGTGIMTRVFAPKAGRVIATDVAPKMLKRATKKLKDMDHVLFEEADITDLRFGDNSFDITIAANVIHLVDDPQKAASELMRVTKPRGLVIVPTYITQEKKTAKLAVRLLELIGADFKKEFTAESYKEYWKSLGYYPEFRIEDGNVPCMVAIIRKP